MFIFYKFGVKPLVFKCQVTKNGVHAKSADIYYLKRINWFLPAQLFKRKTSLNWHLKIVRFTTKKYKRGHIHIKINFQSYFVQNFVIPLVRSEK